MAENYKHLYEQMKKMVAVYQDEIVPGMREQIEDLEKNQIGVRCKDCVGKAHWYKNDYGCTICGLSGLFVVEDNDFCSYGERREGE